MHGKALLAVLLAASLVSTTASAQAPAHFSGDPELSLDPDGRHAILLKDFSFADPKGKLWAVPKGVRLDGATIPQVFWSITGGPWDGPYRDASIIHDYYCDTHSRPWRSVHRVFYDGMIARHMPELTAKLMYYAVYKFGPRWETKTTQVPALSFDGNPTMVTKSVTVAIPTAAYDPQKFDEAQTKIKQSDLSIDQIEALADIQ